MKSLLLLVCALVAGCAHETTYSRYYRYHPGYGARSTTYAYTTVPDRFVASNRYAVASNRYAVAPSRYAVDSNSYAEDLDPDLDGWNQRRYYGNRYHDNRYYVDQAYAYRPSGYAYRPSGATREIYVVVNGEPVRRIVNVDVNNRPYEWVNGRRYYITQYYDSYPRRYYSGRRIVSL